jgi:hypothetical protein
MNAVEHLAGLDDATRGAGSELGEGIAARSVDPGETENMDWLAGPSAELAPRVLGRDPLPGSLADRRRRRRFVDPAAATVAIDADGDR